MYSYNPCAVLLEILLFILVGIVDYHLPFMYIYICVCVYLTRIYCERVVVSLLSCRTVLLTSTIPSVLFISVRGFFFIILLI